MSRIFNLENPIWRFMGRIADVFTLNILWLVFSIPIITIGASTTALYYTGIKLVRDEGDSIFRMFFASFKQNFKQATILWLIFLIFPIIFVFDVYYYKYLSSPVGAFMSSVIMVFGIIYIMVITYVFPVLSKFDNSLKNIVMFSFVLSIRHIISTILMAVITIAVFGLAFLVYPPILLLGEGLVAYLNSYILSRVLYKYIPGEKKENRCDDREWHVEDSFDNKDKNDKEINETDALNKDIDKKVERINESSALKDGTDIKNEKSNGHEALKDGKEIKNGDAD